ncbi:ead/Ea22-like family protein [Escherichia coli]|uniref:Ead/Ea22-like family protein n=2 Tax=Escherichia coli TaxID=562 RepID=A0A8S7I9Z4_ECOLX|nr:ead/Ea22-like family protein [Escherichia coli]EBI5303893.1 ead/Ea22-like family protein [Salmonella enterica subsp. enterica serovar Meleagridis]EEC5991621.1 ead/Ea22-like family protein [Salmonella enterica]EFA8565860.1 ead/Ea22-like family protein [Escherichia coli O157]EKA5905718.1 ead/Ea22-like family protein [Salmonella enterica subsp. enterica serovar Muenchen]EDQ0160334.1 ead/Ea22-like family protein [Salmonella enterica subsp. enterica serovar Meleagridis]
MNSINYQVLREAAQNYQSMLAWYEAIPDGPNAEVDCDEALAAFKRQIRHREVDIIADLLDELEAAKKRIAELEEKETLRPVGVMSKGAFWRPENSESRFIALWPRPGIYLPRKRPDDGVIVYARTDTGIEVVSAPVASGIRIKGENDTSIKD